MLTYSSFKIKTSLRRMPTFLFTQSYARIRTEGRIAFTTSVDIGKIEFTYHPWLTTKDTNIVIGNRKITHKANEGYSTPIVDSIAFASTNEVKISTTATNLINEETRVCILKLKLYVVAK